MANQPPPPYQVQGSPGIAAGRILATETQYNRWGSEVKQYFTPICISPGTTMYRYIHATEPYLGRSFDVEDLDPNDMHEHFMILVNEFIVALQTSLRIHTIMGDEDEDFTYGALCTALATLNQSEADWLLEHLFGNMYCMRHIDTLEEDE